MPKPTCITRSARGMPHAQAKRKKDAVISRVSWFGMLRDSTSAVAARITSSERIAAAMSVTTGSYRN